MAGRISDGELETLARTNKTPALQADPLLTFLTFIHAIQTRHACRASSLRITSKSHQTLPNKLTRLRTHGNRFNDNIIDPNIIVLVTKYHK